MQIANLVDLAELFGDQWMREQILPAVVQRESDREREREGERERECVCVCLCVCVCVRECERE